MGLKKGTTNNPKGRPQGSPNKITANLRQKIQDILENNWHTVEKDIKKLEPKDRLFFIEKLLKYAVPTLQATQLTTDFDKMTDEQLDYIINELKTIATNGQAGKN